MKKEKDIPLAGQVQQSVDLIKEAKAALAWTRLPFIRRFQKWLRGIETKDFGPSLNRELVEYISQTLEELQVLLRCPAPGCICPVPAKLRFDQSGRSASGIIQYSHYIPAANLLQGQKRLVKHGGDSSFQELTLVFGDGSPIPPESTNGTFEISCD